MLIPLTRGLSALVDAIDFDRLARFKWYAHASDKGFYAARRVRDIEGKRGIVWMHREVLMPDRDLEADHMNGDGLDNRRSNLRAVSRSMNARNSTLAMGKGACPCPQTGRVFARASLEGQRIFLGRYNFKSEAQAAVEEARIMFDMGTPIEEIRRVFKARARHNLYSGSLALRATQSPPLPFRADGFAGSGR